MVPSPQLVPRDYVGRTNNVSYLLGVGGEIARSTGKRLQNVCIVRDVEKNTGTPGGLFSLFDLSLDTSGHTSPHMDRT